jgi:hypothetical protein
MNQWGIAFDAPAAIETELRSAFPEPSATAYGRGVFTFEYRFAFMPQSRREWQRVASIKVQMQQRFPQIEFHGPAMMAERLYTIRELGAFFPGFVRWPKPQWPQSIGDEYKMLTRHAKRLHWAGMLHIEQLIAVSIRFNAEAKSVTITRDDGSVKVKDAQVSPREVMRRAKAAYLFAKENRHLWPAKLNADQLKDARRKGAMAAAKLKRENAAPKKELAIKLREEGHPLRFIADEVGVGRSTVARWLAE